MEYQAFIETLQAEKGDEVAELRKRLDALMTAQIQTPVLGVQAASVIAAQGRAAHARAAKKNKRKTTKPAMA